VVVGRTGCTKVCVGGEDIIGSLFLCVALFFFHLVLKLFFCSSNDNLSLKSTAIVIIHRKLWNLLTATIRLPMLILKVVIIISFITDTINCLFFFFCLRRKEAVII